VEIESMNGWTQTVTAKVLGIALLALLMTIPLMQVSGLVRERRQLRQKAIAQIAQGWGGEQVLGSPVLVVPTLEAQLGSSGDAARWRAGSHSMLADTATLDVAMTVDKRSYGIYTAPVFVASVRMHASYRADDLARLRRDIGTPWQGDKAQLRVPIGDLRGLQQVSHLLVNGRLAHFDSSAEHLGAWTTIAVPIDLDALAATPSGGADQPLQVDISFQLAGTQSLQLLPLARSTDVAMHAPWHDPSFIGAALPLARTLDARGFSAHWHMLDLNRNYSQHWDDSVDMTGALQSSVFGVQLYQPVDVYQRNERAGKYGLLFIAMTFVAFFLFETLKKLRVHPVQYLLVGAALATFYVVLLALSEQIGFAPAYALAASAVVLIVGGYATAVLRAARDGILLAAALGLIYVMLYALIAAEQYALLIGALVLLAMVALMMYLTRRIDWYVHIASVSASAASPPPSPPVIMEQP
jgi:inner membrane protein